jgi:NADH dehydrogenase/NADH:ubiquinone oxidoreductase subunit G
MEGKRIMPPSTLTINGETLTFEPGQTILTVARGAGISVPTLCDYKDTMPTGACRVCVVEVEGARTLLPACATQAAPGMVVQTESPRVVAARKTVIELLLASGNHQCLICEATRWQHQILPIPRIPHIIMKMIIA